MAKFVPTKCQICGSDMFLTQPAIRKGDTRSVAKGHCLMCREEHEYTVLLNPRRQKTDQARLPEGQIRTAFVGDRRKHAKNRMAVPVVGKS